LGEPIGRQKGFTVIEGIIIVVILGVFLSTIALPRPLEVVLGPCGQGD
jgi:Tfp pilus assembly protein PilE